MLLSSRKWGESELFSPLTGYKLRYGHGQETDTQAKDESAGNIPC